MERIAVFVDAGYLFAQGSVALTGSKKARIELTLNASAAVAELMAVASAKISTARLLRIYWYDGARGNRMTVEQEALAYTDNVKVRLGFVNSSGQQKGVDSLIVTDLIELARNHAITDALLLAGDEDVRVGVQIAQNFGVRIHLLGIIPSRGSQSKQLMHEADTTSEWNASTVGGFLSLATTAASTTTVTTTTTVTAVGGAASGDFDSVVGILVAAIDPGIVATLKAGWLTSGAIPREFDGKLIARCGAVVGRNLNAQEMKDVRKKFRDAVKGRS